MDIVKTLFFYFYTMAASQNGEDEIELRQQIEEARQRVEASKACNCDHEILRLVEQYVMLEMTGEIKQALKLYPPTCEEM